MRNFKMMIFILAFLLSTSLNSCEEDLLDIDIRARLEGSWNVREDNILKSVDYYTVTITQSSSDTTTILINNFYALGEIVQAQLSGFNITIPQQNVSTFTIKGYGTVSLNMKNIEWSYTVDYHNNFIDQVTATYSRTN